MRKNGNVTARLGRNHPLDSLTHAVLVEQTVDKTAAEKFLRFASSLFGDLHKLQAATWRAVSSASLRWSSLVKTLPVTAAVVWTTSRPTSLLSSPSIRA